MQQQVIVCADYIIMHPLFLSPPPSKGSNGEFTYQILGRQSGYEFQINPLTAVINVTGDLDYESGDIKYTFIVR